MAPECLLLLVGPADKCGLGARQTQSDLIGIPVKRPVMREMTALGAAIAAGLAAGIWESLDDIKDVNPDGCTLFQPSIPAKEAARQFERWEKAVQMSKGWAS